MLDLVRQAVTARIHSGQHTCAFAPFRASRRVLYNPPESRCRSGGHPNANHRTLPRIHGSTRRRRGPLRRRRMGIAAHDKTRAHPNHYLREKDRLDL